MDPNACATRLIRAIVHGDKMDALSALQDLAEWLGKGGFAPYWGGVVQAAEAELTKLEAADV